MVQTFDYFTVGHFLWGIIMVISIYPDQPLLSLIVANILHLIMEMLEKTVDERTGKILESTNNHMSDCVAFLMGTLVGLPFTRYTKDNMHIRAVFGIVSMLIIIQEIGREVFPYSWPYRPAFS